MGGAVRRMCFLTFEFVLKSMKQGSILLYVRQIQGPLGSFNRFVKLSCLCVRSRQRAENDWIAATGKPIRLLSKNESFDPVSNRLFSRGRQHPCQIALGLYVLWLNFQRLLKMNDR